METTEIQADLRITDAVPWTNERHATPIRSMRNVVQCARPRFECDAVRLHPDAISLIKNTREFAWLTEAPDSPAPTLDATVRLGTIIAEDVPVGVAYFLSGGQTVATLKYL